MLELAPDAILAHDLDLVRDLFEVFDSEMKHDKIEEWFVRGKVIQNRNALSCLLISSMVIDSFGLCPYPKSSSSTSRSNGE